MQSMIWIGAALAMIGLLAILFSAFRVAAARKSGIDDDALKAQLSKMLTVNMAGLLVAVIGLMSLILGISLG